MNVSSTHLLTFFSTIATLFCLSACGSLEDFKNRQAERAEERAFRETREAWAAEHTSFREKSGSKKKTYRNNAALEMATPENIKVEISISEQRGYLLVRNAVAMDFPVATGKRSHPTPTGNFSIRSKSEKYASNLYGKIVDANGEVVLKDATNGRDPVPEGGAFVGASMPYWMRLTDSGVGLHIGYVPGRPASHGCIRLPRDVAPQLFKIVKVGTPVEIAEVAPVMADKKK